MARKIEVQLVLKDQATAAIKKFDKNAKTSAVGVKKLDTNLKSLGRTSTRLRSTLGGLFVGISGAMILRDMTRTIAGFEQSMTVVRGVTRATAEDFTLLRDKARELGATTVFTAQQAADAMVALSRAGFDANETLSVVGDSLNLAAAGNIELAEAADYTAGLIRTFNLAAEESTRVVDTMVNAANNANTDVRQFAQAMKYAGPVAAALGKSIEETAATIGVLADRNIKANLGGTNLRGVLLGLASASDSGQAALQKMGLTVQQLDVGNRDLAGVLELLGQGFNRITDATERAAAAEALFGRRNIGAALILADSSKTIREKVALYKELEGETKRLADLAQDTLGGSFKALRSAVEELYLATGDEGLAGSLKAMIDTVTGAIRVLAGMGDKTGNLSEASRQLARIVEALTVGLIRFVQIKVVFFAISAARALWTMAAGMTAAAAGTTTLTAALAINPITAFAVAIAGVAFAFRYFSADVKGATSDLDKYDEGLVRVGASAKSVAAAFGKLTRAKLSGSLNREAQAIASIVHTINEKADELQGTLEKFGKFGKRGAGGPARIKMADLIEVAPDIGETQWFKDLADRFSKVAQAAGIKFDPLKDMPGITVPAANALKGLEQVAAAYGVQLTDVNKRLAEYRNKQDAAREGDRQRVEFMEAIKRYQEGAQKSLIAYLQQLDEEIGLLKILNSEGEIAAEIAKAKLTADQAGLVVSEAQIDALRKALELRKQLQDQSTQSVRVPDMPALPGHDGASWAQPEGFGEGFKTFAHWDKQSNEWRSTAHEMADVGSQAASAMFNSFQVQFFDPMTGAFRSLGEIVRDFVSNFLQQMAQIAAQQAALAIIKGIGGALFSGGGTEAGTGDPFYAKGGVFDRGGEVTKFAMGGVVKPFATGGIVTRPTVFPFARGAGLMGEAGPEAIMPLRRGPGGRLGVEASGSSTINITYAPTIQAQDAKGVREELNIDRERFTAEVIRVLSDGRGRRAVKGAVK